MTREILILGTGNSVKVDDEHFTFALGVSPFHISNSGNGYACSYINGKQQRLHRLLFEHVYGYSPKEIDHKNGNKFDNQIENLRDCTRSQNQANSKIREGSSKYKGVHWNKSTSKWQASIRINYKPKHLGLFNSELKAAFAYDDAAIEAFGEFASLNFPERYR